MAFSKRENVNKVIHREAHRFGMKRPFLGLNKLFMYHFFACVFLVHGICTIDSVPVQFERCRSFQS